MSPLGENPFAIHVDKKAKFIDVCSHFSISHSIGSEELREIVLYIAQTFKIEKLADGAIRRNIVSLGSLLLLQQILSQLLDQLQNGNLEVLERLTEVLRALRNSTSCSKVQNDIVNNTNIVFITDELFKKVREIDKQHISLKILLQFLINLVSTNEIAAKQIHSSFEQNLMICLHDRVYIYETSALIYNVSLSVPMHSSRIIEIFLDLHNSNQFNEYISFFLETIISTSDFWNVYKKLQLEHKIVTLGVVKDIQHERKSLNLPEIALDILLNSFLQSSHIVFQTQVDDLNNLKASEVSLVLQILSSLSSNEDYLFKFQKNKDLLINVGVLLINIHRLGRAPDSCFTPVRKLSEFDTENELRNHPAYGFKGDLVRLIGNLCWKNLEMQNLARTAELIPIILECSNIDARNPFIVQWTILAIRNLCEGNLENQKIVAGLHQQGTVNTSTLEEMGITLHSDSENQLKIVALDSLKHS